MEKRNDMKEFYFVRSGVQNSSPNWNTACKIIDEVQHYIDRGEMLYDLEIIEIIQSILDAQFPQINQS